MVVKRQHVIGMSALIAGLIAGWGVQAPVAGQMRGAMGPMYDTKTEVTLTGTVEEVKEMTGMMGAGRMGRRGAGPEGMGPKEGGREGRGMRGGGMPGMAMQGTHLMLKTAGETIDVHLGPPAFLKEQGIAIAKGDVVEIVGSRMKMGDSAALIAREIRKGEASWRLRDAEGRPLWMGMQKGQP